MKLSSEGEVALYSWVAWLRSQHPAEYRRFRRYGTPSDALVRMASAMVELSAVGPACPASLSTGAGQAEAYHAMMSFEQWRAAIPTLARIRIADAYAVADKRRTRKARETARSVFRFVLLRAAHESSTVPRCSFESIQVAVGRDIGRSPNHTLIRDALKLASDSDGPLSVARWGERGNFLRPTVMLVKLAEYRRKWVSPDQQSQTDEWLMVHGHVLEAVLRREEDARRSRPDRIAAYAAAVEAKREKYDAQAAQFRDYLDRMIREGDRMFLTMPGDSLASSFTGIAELATL